MSTPTVNALVPTVADPALTPEDRLELFTQLVQASPGPITSELLEAVSGQVLAPPVAPERRSHAACCGLERPALTAAGSLTEADRRRIAAAVVHDATGRFGIFTDESVPSPRMTLERFVAPA